MCPLCITSATVIAAGSSTAAGLAAAIVTRLRPKKHARARSHDIELEAPAFAARNLAQGEDHDSLK